MSTPDYNALAQRIRTLAHAAGFQRVGIAGVELKEDEAHLLDWLNQQLHGSMDWMARHGSLRARPHELLPGTIRVISVGLDYGKDPDAAWDNLREHERAYVARYALGRDYHKLMRNRLQKLAEVVQAEIGPFGHRAFTDSAPVLERALARNAGLGWIGKHTCLIDKDGGSWFFLGELFVDIPLPIDPPASAHCGSCTRCIDICPTGAITAPYRLDARRCISYLTIEHEGSIDEALSTAVLSTNNLATGRYIAICRRAEEYLRESGMHVHSSLEVARACEVNVRTLHNALISVLGMSLGRYLMLRRLWLARRALSRAAPGDLVKSIALDYGFWHLGRFSRIYQQEFGELPSTTLERRRSGG